MQKNESTYPTFFKKIIFASFNQLQISLFLITCSLGYVFLATIKLNATALHNDEMLFVNAAIGDGRRAELGEVAEIIASTIITAVPQFP